MMNKILKKTMIYLTVATLVIGTGTTTYGATQTGYDFDGDITENPWADLFKKDTKDPGNLDIDDQNNKNKNNNTDKITVSTVKKALKTSVVLATKKSKKAKKATVKVKQVTKLKNVKYQVRYGTSKKLKKYKTKTFKRNKFTLTKLKANKKYYVKVRAYVVTKNKKKVYGTWSKTKPIKVKKK